MNTKLEVEALRMQAKPMLVAVAAIMLLYTASVMIEPGVVTWLLTLPPSFIIAITALVRLNDICPMGHAELRWQVRRFGFILAGMATVSYVLLPFTSEVNRYPAWREVYLPWGVACAWLTTPNMQPWFKYITGAASWWSAWTERKVMIDAFKAKLPRWRK